MILALSLALAAPAMPVLAADDGDRLICRMKRDPRTHQMTGAKDCRTKAEWRGDYAEEDAKAAAAAAAPKQAPAEASAQAAPPQF